MAIKFTQKSVRDLEVREKAYTVGDTQVPHLRVKVHPSGKKVYFYQFKERGKQFKGSFGTIDQMTIDDARRKARDKRGAIDPVMEKRSDVLTIAELAQSFIFEFVPRKSEKTQSDYVRHAKFLVENFGKLNVKSVDRMTAKAIIKKYSMGKSNTTFNRAKATYSSMWKYGIQNTPEGVIEYNPFAIITKLEEEDRSEIYATDEELGRIIRSVMDDENKIVMAYNGTIIYTMCRRGEADKMKWGQIGEDDIWTKPKTNTKQNRTHRIRLSQPVLDLLAQIPKGKPEDLVFQGFKGFGKAWKRILERAGLKYPGLRVHDMRGTMAIWALKNDLLTVEEVSRMLGHSSVAVTQAKYAPYVGANEKGASVASMAPVESEKERDERLKKAALDFPKAH